MKPESLMGLLAWMLSGLVIMALPLEAEGEDHWTHTWTGTGTGLYWNQGANWDPNHVPVNTDTAIVNNGGTCNVGYVGGGNKASEVKIAADSGTTGTVTMNYAGAELTISSGFYLGCPDGNRDRDLQPVQRRAD